MKTEVQTTINGKKVLGIAGNMAFLENGSFHYLTNEVINNTDYYDETFTMPTVRMEAVQTTPMTEEQKKSNYKGKNFDPNFKKRFANTINVSTTLTA
jgi:hypothetical protein